MIRTDTTLWAPVSMDGRKPWIIYSCVRSTRRDAKTAYLQDIDPVFHKRCLKGVKFMKVFIATQPIKENT